MIILVSHDAGGAEILSSWAKQNKTCYDEDIRYLVEGPALKIFKKKLYLHEVMNREEFSQISHSANFVLTGTSWQSDLEKWAISRCRQNEVKVISFIDHWLNYQERFYYQNEMVLPHELWAGDDNALQIAQQTFPSLKISHIPNPYFLDIKNDLNFYHEENQRNNEIKDSILYCAEPIAEHCLKSFGNERHFGYNEYDALLYFLNWYSTNKNFLKEKNIILRLHPSETIGKYDHILSQFDTLNIQYSKNESLAQDVSLSNIVVGCESMALVVGLLAKKQVYSTIPPSGRKCVLPFKEIVPLSNILSR